jgi:type IV pilus modification protein PilV
MKQKLHYTHQHGFSLIETMVAMIVLSLGMLGAVALQFTTAKEQRSSQFVSRAALAANEMAERMRGNRAGLELGFYLSPLTTYTTSRAAIAVQATVPDLSTCGSQPECPTAVAAEQADTLALWNVLRSGMPQASAHIIAPNGPTSLRRDIVIAWVEPVVDKNAAGNPSPISSTPVNGIIPSGCPASIKAPDGVRCYQMRFTL